MFHEATEKSGTFFMDHGVDAYVITVLQMHGTHSKPQTGLVLTFNTTLISV